MKTAGALGLFGLVLVSGAAACGLDVQGRLAGTDSPVLPAPSDSIAPTPTDPPSVAPPAQPEPADDSGAPDAPDAPAVCQDGVLTFDGKDDDATVPYRDEFDLADDFTVEAWIRPTADIVTSAWARGVVSHADPASERGWSFLVQSGRVLLLVWGRSGILGDTLAVGTPLAGAPYVVPDHWAHVAGTLQGSILRVYYDGVLRAEQELPFNFLRRRLSGDPLHIGSMGNPNFGGSFSGSIDGVRLSDVARYISTSFQRPTAPFPLDPQTVALFNFDEPQGLAVDFTDTVPGADAGKFAPGAAAPARALAACVAER